MEKYTFEEYQAEVRRMNGDCLKDDLMFDAKDGLAKSCRDIRRLLKEYCEGEEVNRMRMRESIGMLLWNCAELAEFIGADLEELAKEWRPC